MTMAISALAGLVAALLFAYVGLRLGRRIVTTPEARAAFTMFRAWWYALALATLVVPVRQILHMNGLLQSWAYSASQTLVAVFATAALWALLCNLVYLYTGSVRWWGPLTLAYALVAVFLVGLVAWIGPPMALGDDGWEIVAVTSNAIPAWGAFGLLAFLLGPQLLAAIFYLGLLRHAPEATQRYRIVLVAASLILWFGSVLGAAFIGLTGGARVFVSQGLGILAAIAVLLAYDPPAAIRRQLGVQRAGEETPPRPTMPARSASPPR